MRLPESWFVARTVQALELLAFQPLSAPQVAEMLQVHPRTARRLLNRLRDEGYLTRSDDARRQYAPTMRLVAIAGQIVERSGLARAALPFVRRLRERTGATAHLVVPSYRWAQCLVHAGGACDEPLQPRIRELVPSHCTASGKALLGFRDAWRDSVLSAPLERHTDRTLTDPDALRREAASIRARGYATEDGEYRPGARAAAAPVFQAGEAVAALSVSTDDGQPPEELATAVLPLAHELSEALEAARG